MHGHEIPYDEYSAELTAAAAPFKDLEQRAAAFGDAELISHYKERAELAKDIRALEVTAILPADEMAHAISLKIRQSSVYGTSPKSQQGRVFATPVLHSLQEYVEYRNQLEARSGKQPLAEGTVPYASHPFYTKERDFDVHVRDYLGRRDAFAEEVLLYKERKHQLAEQRRSAMRARKQAADKGADEAELQAAKVLQSTEDFGHAYPSVIQPLTSAQSTAIRNLAPGQTLTLDERILSRMAIDCMLQQAHYELGAPLLAQSLVAHDTRLYPWREQFLRSAAKVRQHLTEKYAGKTANLTMTLLESDEAWLQKLFETRAAPAPDMNEVRRVLWSLVLMPTGKAPILSSVESLTYIQQADGILTPTIISGRLFRQDGRAAVAKMHTNARNNARKAAKPIFQGGLPELGRKR